MNLLSLGTWLLGACLTLGACCALNGAEPRKLTLQLKWHHQFQFAGFYAAQRQGFYREEGLELNFQEAGPGRLPLKVVESGGAEFGVSDAEVFYAYLEGRPLVALGVIFQHSPNVILALKKSGILRPSDLAGRRVMFQGGQGLVEVRAMLEAEGVHLETLKQIPHSWNLDDLLEGRVDALSAYATNEPFLLKAKGAELIQLRPIEYGVDFYGDLLFTTRAFADRNPAVIEAFCRASFRGWDYAMEHPEEIITYILSLPGAQERGLTREKLRFEAERMRELLLPGLVDAGHMNPGRFRRMAETAARQGLVKSTQDPEGFLFTAPPPATRALWRALTLGGPILLGVLGLIGLWIFHLRRVVRAKTQALREEIREREAKAKALQEREAQFDNLVMRIPIGVYLLRSRPDGSLSFDFVSARTAELLGVDHEALSKDVSLGFAAVHPEDSEAFVKLNQDGLKTLVPFYWEGRVLVGGETQWLNIASQPEILANGEVLWHGVVVDISRRKLAEEALTESETRFRTHVEQSFDIIFTLDDQGHFLFVSDAWERQLGRPVSEVVGRHFSYFTHPEDVAPCADYLTRVLLTRQGGRSPDFRVKRQDGAWRCFVVNGSPYEDAQGRIQFIGIGRDVTEAHEAAERQQRLQSHLQQAQKMESLGSLAGGVAHDMNNVLGAILALASAHIDAQPKDSPLHRAFATIIKAAERGGQMVKSLLNFARQAPAEIRDLNLNDLVQDEIQLLERTTLAKVRLELALAENLHPIRGDGGALTHALMNLCVNAVDAMPEGGTLTLSTRNLDHSWVEVQVQDTGSGMSPGVLERALDPFFTTKEVGKGTGLGLSMVYSTVKAHGGEMDIASEPGRGTLVKLRLPAVKSQAPHAELPILPPTKAEGTGLNVLLVDDDELIQSSVQSLLEALGHRVQAAFTGEAALALLKGGLRPEVVILDMNMPGWSGAETLPRLRALCPDTPVLLSTGRADQAAMDLVASHAKVKLLPKPFTLKDLRDHLGAIGGR